MILYFIKSFNHFPEKIRGFSEIRPPLSPRSRGILKKPLSVQFYKEKDSCKI